MKEEKKMVMYGSIYADEFKDYKRIVEEQFKGCAEKAKKDGIEIEVWGFDVGVRDNEETRLFPPTEEDTRKVEAWVKECAEKYLPGIPNVSEVQK